MLILRILFLTISYWFVSRFLLQVIVCRKGSNYSEDIDYLTSNIVDQFSLENKRMLKIKLQNKQLQWIFWIKKI